MSTFETYARLFRGRLDAYGTDEGGCDWVDEDHCDLKEYMHRVAQHLTIGPSMGVYPLMPDGTVRWGCVDFDEGEEASLIHAQNLEMVLAQLGVTGWIERSRAKGYHVWIFTYDDYEAQLVRDALMGACQLVDAPIKEVNPKQVTLAEGQVGNYVRLPYPGKGIASRQVVLYDGDELDLAYFVNLAQRELVTSEQLVRLAELYVPPPPVVIAKRPYINDGRTAAQKLDGLSFTVFRDGPLDGSDRSDTLWKFSCMLRENEELTFDEALDLLIDADSRWGKFYQRTNGDQQLVRMLSKAWGYA